MQKNIEIVEAKEISEDLINILNKLSFQLGENPQLLDLSGLEQIISEKSIYLFLAKRSENGEIVGMLTLVTFRTPYKKKGTIEDVVVDMAVRGQGVGKQLVQKAVKKAKKMQIKDLMLTSNPSRLAANALYRKMGFEKYETNVYKMSLE